MQGFARLLAVLSVAVPLATAANAADIVVHSTSFGAVSEPFTTSIGQSYNATNSPINGDRFVDDYGFIVGSSSFSSIAATFDLGTALSINSLSIRLFTGEPQGGGLPHPLSIAELAWRSSGTLVTGVSSGNVDTIAPFALAPGHYVLEVSGLVTGSFGGSYAGVVNVVAVPDLPGSSAALAGFLLLGVVAVRRRG